MNLLMFFSSPVNWWKLETEVLGINDDDETLCLVQHIIDTGIGVLQPPHSCDAVRRCRVDQTGTFCFYVAQA